MRRVIVAFQRVCATLCLLGVWVGAGCSTTTTNTVLRPPKAPEIAAKVRDAQDEGRRLRIAVAEFDGNAGFNGRGGAASMRSAVESMLTTRRSDDGAPVFAVVEIQNQDRIERELGAQLSGLRDPSTAVRLGALLNAEALIFGTVDSYGVRTLRTPEERRYCAEPKEDEEGCARFAYRVVICTNRDASVSMTARWVDLTTGAILLSRGFASVKSARRCADDTVDAINEVARAFRNLGRPYSPSISDVELLNSARRDVIADFARYAAPYEDRVRVAFKTNARSLSRQDRRSMKGAIAFIREGRVDVGCERLFTLADSARDFDLYYNVAICHELNGNYEDALTTLTALERELERPDRDITERIAIVQRLLAEQQR